MSTGWSLPAASDATEPSLGLVKLDDGKIIPSRFILSLWPKEPADSWMRIWFEVLDGKVAWPSMAAGGMNVDAAVDVLRKAMPMKEWANLTVTYLWIQLLLEQVKDTVDSEALAKLLGIPIPQAADYILQVESMPSTGMIRGLSPADAQSLAQNPMWSAALTAARDRYDRSGFAPIDDVPVRGAPRRNSVTKKHLRDVAQVYRRAVADGIPPTKAVADHFGASHSTAARWVSMAREPQNGFLNPVSRGRSGEDTPPSTGE